MDRLTMPTPWPGVHSLLFRTVYGPELPVIHAFVSERGRVPRVDLTHWFVQQAVGGTEATNLDEATAFLISGGLLLEESDQPGIYRAHIAADFRLELLKQLMAVYRDPDEGRHPLDCWYMGFLDHCFTRPNQIFVARVHTAVNSLELPVPCSEEKVNAWRRVMEYLGCGRRVHAGFMASYDPDLVLLLLRGWRSSGPLEEFLHHAETYVPVRTATGDMTGSLTATLIHLERAGRIKLLARADYAGRGFLGERRIKWLTLEV